jgi:hypothetical protein
LKSSQIGELKKKVSDELLSKHTENYNGQEKRIIGCEIKNFLDKGSALVANL